MPPAEPSGGKRQGKGKGVDHDSSMALDEWFIPKALPFKRRPMPQDMKGKKWRKLKQIVQTEGFENLPATEATYINIEAAPSVYPPKKYCDITGFEAAYTDPKTRLRYATADLYAYVRSLPYEAVQQYLSVRNAQVVLK